MTPPEPLGDDWLYWDPHAIDAYPHSADAPAENDYPVQLELFPPGARLPANEVLSYTPHSRARALLPESGRLTGR